jgi:hypothetical protein
VVWCVVWCGVVWFVVWFVVVCGVVCGVVCVVPMRTVTNLHKNRLQALQHTTSSSLLDWGTDYLTL